jgi:hypothetical protein
VSCVRIHGMICVRQQQRQQGQLPHALLHLSRTYAVLYWLRVLVSRSSASTVTYCWQDAWR